MATLPANAPHPGDQVTVNSEQLIVNREEIRDKSTHFFRSFSFISFTIYIKINEINEINKTKKIVSSIVLTQQFFLFLPIDFSVSFVSFISFACARAYFPLNRRAQFRHFCPREHAHFRCFGHATHAHTNETDETDETAIRHNNKRPHSIGWTICYLFVVIMSVRSKNKHKNFLIKDTIDHPMLLGDFSAPTSLGLSF